MNRKHNSRMYRSGLEVEAAAYLKDRQKKVAYEELKIEWEDLKYRTYTPDFELDNGIIIEQKVSSQLQIVGSTLRYSDSIQDWILDLYSVMLDHAFTRGPRVGIATGVTRRALSGLTVSYQKNG